MNLELSQLGRKLADDGVGRTRLFFRDDDATADRPSLRRLLSIFESRRVPINIAIIPGLLTDDGVQLLRDSHLRHPDLIGLNQHGWRHENHEPNGRRSEFGPSRAADLQRRDIGAGRQRMEEAFGRSFFPVFIPPWNRCAPTTLRALAELEFAAISDFRRSDPPAPVGIARLPATLDIIDWKGTRDLRSPAELLVQLAEQIPAAGAIGLLLHHQVMSDRAFEFITRLLDTLIDSDVVSFHLFQSLLRSEHE